jgi:glycerophosphoryl diester phosphodiesterase
MSATTSWLLWPLASRQKTGDVTAESRGTKQASLKAHAAAVVNNAEEFSEALAAPNADWVYFRYLPTKEQIDAVRAKKRAFIAGATVAGNLPENWQQASEMGIDGILTDYPLDLRTVLRKQFTTAEKP